MDYVIIIISAVIAGVGLVAGGIYWKKFKDILKQVKVVFDMIIAAIEDDQITREELDLIVKEAQELFELFKSKNEKITELEKKVKDLKSRKKK